MSNELCLIGKQLLTDIANAIRSKTGKTALIYPKDMDTEILSIDTEAHLPITVNITQSEHQTITVTPDVAGFAITNGQITVPTSIQLTATIAPDTGYTAGTLNHSSVTAAWGDTASFSATPATVQKVGVLNVSMSTTADHPNLGDQVNYTYTFKAVGGSTSAQVFYDGLNSMTFTVPALSENQTDTYTPYSLRVSEGDILNNIDTDVLTSASSFTKSGPFIIETAVPNGHLTVSISNIDYDDPLEENSTINFDVTVLNDGNLTITDVRISSLISSDEWNGLSLVPQESYTYPSLGAFVTATDVENGYIRLDASAEGTSPDPDNPNVPVTNAEEDISIASPSYMALIYMVHSGGGNFTISTTMSSEAQTQFDSFMTSEGISNPQLNTLYREVNGTSTAVRNITPETDLIFDNSMATYNANAYTADTSATMLPDNITVMFIDAETARLISPAYSKIASSNQFDVSTMPADTTATEEPNEIFLMLGTFD